MISVSQTVSGSDWISTNTARGEYCQNKCKHFTHCTGSKRSNWISQPQNKWNAHSKCLTSWYRQTSAPCQVSWRSDFKYIITFSAMPGHLPGKSCFTIWLMQTPSCTLENTHQAKMSSAQSWIQNGPSNKITSGSTEGRGNNLTGIDVNVRGNGR